MGTRTDVNTLAASTVRLAEAVARLQETVRRHGYRLEALERAPAGGPSPSDVSEVIAALENAVDWLIHSLRDTQERLEACERRLAALEGDGGTGRERERPAS